MTGGRSSSSLSSTEIHVLSSSAGSTVASLPSVRTYFPAVNVNNAVYVFGKINSERYCYCLLLLFFLGGLGGRGNRRNEYYDDIYRYDPTLNSWLDPAGHKAASMKFKRNYHSASLLKDVEKFCSS